MDECVSGHKLLHTLQKLVFIHKCIVNTSHYIQFKKRIRIIQTQINNYINVYNAI